MSRIAVTRGLTLIEFLISIVVLGVLIALAIPSFEDQFQRNRLKSAAERLAAEAQFARAEALSRRAPITVTVEAGGNWCIGVDEGNAACDCTVTNPADASACAVDDVIRTAGFDGFKGVSVQGSDVSVTFEPVRGIPVAAVADWPVVFESVNSEEVGVRLTALGSVHMCSPAGSGNLKDYPEC